MMTTLATLTNSIGHAYVTISYDASFKGIVDTWTGRFGAKTEFQKALIKVVELIEQNRYTKWLADLRDMKGSWQSSQDWLAKELMPRAIKAGLKREAVVLPKDIFAKLSTNETIMMIADFTLRQFDDIDQARAWLSSNT